VTRKKLYHDGHTVCDRRGMTETSPAHGRVNRMTPPAVATMSHGRQYRTLPTSRAVSARRDRHYQVPEGCRQAP